MGKCGQCDLHVAADVIPKPELRKRVLASAETYFGYEIGRFDAWLPDDETLAGIGLS